MKKQQLQLEIEEKQNKYKDRFYKANKCYLPKKLLSIKELKLFKQIFNIFSERYWIFPQTGLRPFIQTFENLNDELYRYIDIVMFDDNFNPIIAIELNGEEHSYEPYTIARDLSVEQILNECNIPLVSLWYDEYYSDNELKEIISLAINKWQKNYDLPY